MGRIVGVRAEGSVGCCVSQKVESEVSTGVRGGDCMAVHGGLRRCTASSGTAC